jgi:hypothetical protein
VHLTEVELGPVQRAERALHRTRARLLRRRGGPLTEILGGSGDRQIDAIWLHLRSVALPPKSLASEGR